VNLPVLCCWNHVWLQFVQPDQSLLVCARRIDSYILDADAVPRTRWQCLGTTGQTMVSLYVDDPKKNVLVWIITIRYNVKRSNLLIYSLLVNLLDENRKSQITLPNMNHKFKNINHSDKIYKISGVHRGWVLTPPEISFFYKKILFTTILIHTHQLIVIFNR